MKMTTKKRKKMKKLKGKPVTTLTLPLCWVESKQLESPKVAIFPPFPFGDVWKSPRIGMLSFLILYKKERKKIKKKERLLARTKTE